MLAQRALLGASRTVRMPCSVPSAGVHVEARLAKLGYDLPAPTKSVANYIMCKRVGNLIYTGARGRHASASSW